MVHVHDDGFPLAWRMLAVDVPDELILPLTDIPSDWHEYPYRASVQFRGDEWALGGKSLALSVPSAIVQTASNYLINPLHAAAADLILIDITDAVDLRRLAARLGSKTSV